MLTVLFVNPTSIHGGAEEALLTLMQVTSALGHRPFLLVPNSGWLTSRAEECSIPVTFVETLPSPLIAETWRGQIRHWPINAVHIARHIRMIRADVVHSNTPRTAYHAGLAAKLAGVRTITHVHDIINLPYAQGAKAALLKALSDWTLVPSQAVKEAIVGHVPAMAARVQVLYNARDSGEYDAVTRADLHAQLGLADNAFLVGSVSAMSPWKGQDVLIRAFKQFIARVPSAHLILVGAGQGGRAQDDFEKSLHRLVDELALQAHVTFTGWRDDVYQIMRGLNVFVHVPTQPDPLPTVVIHSKGLGCAIIASRTGGIPEMVLDGETGLLVPPGDADSLAAALLRMHDDADLRASLGRRARQHFDVMFAMDTYKAGVESALHACMTRGQSPV